MRRNYERFPEDFMFQLTKKEFDNWRSQIGTSNYNSKMGLRHPPFVFTEQGVAMLSSVLNSKRSIGMILHIIDTFIQLRKFAKNYDILLDIIIQMELNNEKNFGEIYKILDKLIVKTLDNPRQKIGYKK